MEGNFTVLGPGAFGAWIDPLNPSVIRTGLLKEFPGHITLLATALTIGGIEEFAQKYMEENPTVRGAAVGR